MTRSAPKQNAARISGPVEQSLTQRVYAELRREILNGLPPGTFLSERQLASEYEVSKTPVREALIRLAQDGLVEVAPRRGMRVASLSVEDVRELFGIRRALEGLAAEEAVGSIPSEALAGLRGEFDRAAANSDHERLYELGERLHELIIEAAGNRRLQRMVSSMRAQVERYSRLAMDADGQAAASLAGHMAIIDALERRDRHTARVAVEAHIDGIRESLAHMLMGHGYRGE